VWLLRRSVHCNHCNLLYIQYISSLSPSLRSSQLLRQTHRLAVMYQLIVCTLLNRHIQIRDWYTLPRTRFLPREAMLSAVYAVVVCLSVCVCLSVTLRYCIKTAKHRITQTTPHDSPMTLVFRRQRSLRNSNGIIPLRRRQMQVEWVKIGHFRRKTRYNSKTVQDRCIVSIKVE